VLTTGGRLPARHVIHTVGPVWRGGGSGEPEILARCYRNSLQLAADHDLVSIAFPSIATGAYGYPIDRAASVAIGATRLFLEGDARVRHVRFVLWSAADLAVYTAALERSAP
jgi:O-acetyl-ADP-ribose deacetylase (regulator of RNase III)